MRSDNTQSKGEQRSKTADKDARLAENLNEEILSTLKKEDLFNNI